METKFELFKTKAPWVSLLRMLPWYRQSQRTFSEQTGLMSILGVQNDPRIKAVDLESMLSIMPSFVHFTNTNGAPFLRRALG